MCLRAYMYRWVCPFMCVQVPLCEGVRLHTHDAHTEARGQAMALLLRSCPSLGEWGSLSLRPEACKVAKLGEQWCAGASSLRLPRTGIVGIPVHLIFVFLTTGLNSGVHVYVTALSQLSHIPRILTWLLDNPIKCSPFRIWHLIEDSAVEL